MKTVINPSQVAAAQSFAATVNVNLPELFDLYGLALQFNWSAANDMVGSLKLQVSLDDGSNWVDYSGFTAITAFTGSAVWFLDNKIFPFKRARLVYTRTSGTGTAGIWISGCRL